MDIGVVFVALTDIAIGEHNLCVVLDILAGTFSYSIIWKTQLLSYWHFLFTWWSSSDTK